MRAGPGADVLPLRRQAEACAILQSRDPGVLKRIGTPGIAAVIWQRPPLPGLAGWIAELPAAQLPALRRPVAVGTMEACIHAACEAAGTPAGRMRDLLAGDIAALGFIFAEILRTPLLHLRLDPVSTDACRRFHVDNMTARLLCTYRGAGTQLAPPGQEAAPQELAEASVAILRGRRWPGREATRLLHRSPPIGGTGQTRLLLALDPAGDHPPEAGARSHGGAAAGGARR